MTSPNTPARKQTPLPKREQNKPLDPFTLREMSRKAMSDLDEIRKRNPLPEEFKIANFPKVPLPKET